MILYGRVRLWMKLSWTSGCNAGDVLIGKGRVEKEVRIG